MAIVVSEDIPTLFITFTCNHEWKEIVENLKPGQTYIDRPELVSRVFKLKADEFLDDITVKMYFGKCTAYVHVIEFQKRGLPHTCIY